MDPSMRRTAAAAAAPCTLVAFGAAAGENRKPTSIDRLSTSRAVGGVYAGVYPWLYVGVCGT
jgi:hypothetical protein